MPLSVHLQFGVCCFLWKKENKINLFWKKNAIFFQWIKININKVTMSDYMNPNAGRQGLYSVPCRTRDKSDHRICSEHCLHFGVLLKAWKKQFSTIPLSSFTIMDLVLHWRERGKMSREYHRVKISSCSCTNCWYSQERVQMLVIQAGGYGCSLLQASGCCTCERGVNLLSPC